MGGLLELLQETCLVAKPALPFAVLKRRLERRLQAVGIKVKEVRQRSTSCICVMHSATRVQRCVAIATFRGWGSLQ